MVNRVAGMIKPEISTNLKEYPSIAGRLNGKAALLSVNVATGRFTKWAFIGKLKKNIGLADLMSHSIEDEPLIELNQIYATTENLSPALHQMDKLEQLISKKENFSPYKTLSDFYDAYRSKSPTPKDVCTKLLKIMESDEIKLLNAVHEVHKEEIMQAAKESTKRFEKNEPLSVIDGVPFFVKDEIDINGYHIQFGCSSMLDKHCASTCTVVQKLLDAGAILMGTSNMVFAGLNTIGHNPSKTHGHVKNPYNTEYYCGGSSNGSAAVVSCGNLSFKIYNVVTGLVPFSIGLDGLGSNRIPPAFTGVVGARGTTYRVSNGGTKYDSNNSVVIAPITNNVRDHAIIYGIIAGSDVLHPASLYQPPIVIPDFNDNISELASKIKIGYDSSLTNFAHDKSIITAVESTVQHLKDIGFTVVDYCVPEMNEIGGATRAFFIKDASTSIAKILGKDAHKANFECANATLLNSLGHDITDKEYDQALRQRKRAQHIVKDMFSKFDVFISPMTGLVAQKIVQGDDDNGVLDDVTTTRITTYSALSSATGIPAITVHIDTTPDHNLPIGIQLEASWWKEDVLYELAHVVESFLSPDKRNPKVIVSPL